VVTTNLHLQSTRQSILEYLQRQGRATVKELGALLGLTSTGIRQHLTVLERDGLVEWQQQGEEYYIDEFTCPFPKVAEQDPAICALHVDFVRLLSGGDTRLTQSLLRGQRACTYRIRPVDKPASVTR